MVAMEISPISRFSWHEPSSRAESSEATVLFCQGLLGDRPRHRAAQGPLGQRVTFEPHSEDQNGYSHLN